MTTKAVANIDLTRTSLNGVIQFTGSSLTKDPNDPNQNYVQYVVIPNGVNNVWGCTFDSREVGRPAMPCYTMHYDRFNSPKGDDYTSVNKYWNPLGPANIQVMELGPNDWRETAGANVTIAEVCRRQEEYCREQFALGILIVLVGPVSCSQGNNVASGDAFKNGINAYHTAIVNGEPRWKQYAHRYVDFTIAMTVNGGPTGLNPLGIDGGHANPLHFSDGVHMTPNGGVFEGRRLFAATIQQQLHSLVQDATYKFPRRLKFQRYEA